jgi:hypothetical protein
MQQVLSLAQYVQADLVVGDYEPQVAERPSVELHAKRTFGRLQASLSAFNLVREAMF